MLRCLIISVFLCLSLATSAQVSSTNLKAPMKTVLTIRAKDETTGRELPAHFEVRAVLARRDFKGAGTLATPYSLTLERTDTLVVVTEVPGYAAIEEAMVISCDTCAEYEHIALLAPEDSVFTDLKINDVFRLDNVYFDQSSYVLRPESYPQLDKLRRTLQSNPTLKIEIAGHTDNVGDLRLNQFLSENRAAVIRNYLFNRGIEPLRLRAAGYGDSRPAAPNTTEENKKQNRRVEFTVLAK